MKTKPMALLTINVGISHKHSKLDSDSNGGSSNGRISSKSLKKHTKKEGCNVCKDAKDKSGDSGAHGGGKGKAKACVGGSGGDDNNDLDSQASGGSPTFARSAGLRHGGW